MTVRFGRHDRRQQSGIPAGRAEALALELVPDVPDVPDMPELDPGEVADPTVLFPDGPVASVPLLSRTTLLLTSQHWFVAFPLEPPVPVPCAFAKPPTANNATPHAAASQTFFIDILLFESRRFTMLNLYRRSFRRTHSHGCVEQRRSFLGFSPSKMEEPCRQIWQIRTSGDIAGAKSRSNSCVRGKPFCWCDNWLGGNRGSEQALNPLSML